MAHPLVALALVGKTAAATSWPSMVHIPTSWTPGSSAITCPPSHPADHINDTTPNTVWCAAGVGGRGPHTVSGVGLPWTATTISHVAARPTMTPTTEAVTRRTTGTSTHPHGPIAPYWR